MGFFSRNVKPKAIPMNKYQKYGADYLKNILGMATPNFPSMNVPEMSTAEKTGQSILQRYLNGEMGSDYSLGLGQLRKTVAGGYNPKTSDIYRGFRNSSLMEEEDTVNALQRGLQLRGMSRSSPALLEEGKVRRGYSADRQSLLGELIQRERTNQLNAVTPLMTATNPMNKVSAASSYGSLPRQIDTAQQEAIYNALMQELMFPYQTQTSIAGSLVGANNPGNYLQSYPSGVDKWQTIGSLISTMGIMPFGGMGNSAGVVG